MLLNVLLFLESLGGGELILIFIFVLFFFGSKKIPELARGLGNGMRQFKDAMNGVQRDITDAMHTDIDKDETKDKPLLPPKGSDGKQDSTKE